MSTRTISSSNSYNGFDFVEFGKLLPICELGNMAKVCKLWSEKFSSNAVWKHRYSQFLPPFNLLGLKLPPTDLTDLKDANEGDIKLKLLTYLKGEQQIIEMLLQSTMNERFNSLLRDAISPSKTLDEFLQKPSIERTCHVMNKLGKEHYAFGRALMIHNLTRNPAVAIPTPDKL